MTSSRPYLIRALYEWIVDNELTPFILVNAEAEGVQVPSQYVEDGKIVFNVAPTALQQLDLGNLYISFSARFSGQAQFISFPVASVIAIYARENGKGMVFGEEEDGEEPTPPPAGGDDGGRRPSLRVVK